MCSQNSVSLKLLKVEGFQIRDVELAGSASWLLSHNRLFSSDRRLDVPDWRVVFRLIFNTGSDKLVKAVLEKAEREAEPQLA